MPLPLFEGVILTLYPSSPQVMHSREKLQFDDGDYPYYNNYININWNKMDFRKVIKVGDSYSVTIPPKFMKVLGIKPADSIIMMFLTDKILAITAKENLNVILDYSKGKTTPTAGKQVSLDI